MFLTSSPLIFVEFNHNVRPKNVISVSLGSRKVKLYLLRDEYLSGSAPNSHCPQIIVGKLGKRAMLAATLFLNDNNADYKRVRLFWLNAGKLSPINQKGPKLDLSEFGSWAIWPNNTLRIWDFILGDSESYNGPHRYWMKSYKIEAQGLRYLEYHETLKAYTIGWTKHWKRPDKILKKNDPLREFGLRWKWWGDSAIKRKKQSGYVKLDED